MRRLAFVLGLAWLGVAAPLSAQEPEDEPSDVPDEASSETAGEPSELSDLADESYEPPTVLVIGQRGVPDVLLDEVRALLAQAGTLVDVGGYEREARSRGLAPDAPATIAAIAPELFPDLDLVLVVGANRPSRATLVSLAYHDRFGLQILDEEHAIRGNLLTDESRARTLAEVRLALAVITRPRGGLPQLGGGVAPGAATPGLAVRVLIEAGAGFGTREFSVATAAGVLRLDTAIFPSAAVQLSVDIEPVARGQLTLGADAEYLTSFALVTTDQRIDGSTRETASRSQRIAAGARFSYRVEPSLDAVTIGAALGWSALSFSSQAPVSLPDYTLQGPVLTLALSVPIASRLVTITLAPEAQWIVDVGGALRAIGVDASGASVGGSARIRFRVLEQFFVDVTYRESHAFLSAAAGGGSDVERFAAVRLVYSAM